jgi:hypothetical protein
MPIHFYQLIDFLNFLTWFGYFLLFSCQIYKKNQTKFEELSSDFFNDFQTVFY